jgi:hypothetical protein
MAMETSAPHLRDSSSPSLPFLRLAWVRSNVKVSVPFAWNGPSPLAHFSTAWSTFAGGGPCPGQTERAAEDPLSQQGNPSG